MRLILFVLLIIVFPPCLAQSQFQFGRQFCSEQDTITLDDGGVLFTPLTQVVSVELFSYSAKEKFGKPIIDELKRSIRMKFNKAGCITEMQDGYGQGGKFTYDFSENCVVEFPLEDSSGNLIEKFVWILNGEGKIIEETKYNDVGSIRSKTIREFDAQSRLLEEREYGMFGRLLSRHTLIAKENGESREEKYRYSSSGLKILDYQKIYDVTGNLVEEIDYNMNYYKDPKFVNFITKDDGSLDWDGVPSRVDSISSKSTCKYDPIGNKIEETLIGSDGTIIYKHTYKYDERGNNIEMIYNNSALGYRCINKVTTKYNDKDNQTEKEIYNWWPTAINPDSIVVEKHTYKYDERGNIIEIKFFFNGSLTETKTYEFDDKGENIEYVSLDYDGNASIKREHIIEYDNYGNWTKRITYNSYFPYLRKATEIEERAIVYRD
ncbi:hypothetical protein OAL15_03805 [Flavobacteriales bacterium]|nr:hypothetical protein [Flavobacteriales bacterium]